MPRKRTTACISWLFPRSKNMIKDGITIGLPSCNALTPAHPVPPSAASPGARERHHPPSSSHAQQPPRAINPNPIERQAHDQWNVFVTNVASSPITNMCCMYHIAGSCKFGSSCTNQRSHVPPLGAERGQFLTWIAMCRRLMKKRNASEELQPYTVPLTALDRLFPLRPCPNENSCITYPPQKVQTEKARFL